MATAVAVDERNPAVILAGSENGISISTDAGVSWRPFNDGITDLGIRSVAISTTGAAYASTFSGSLFRTLDRTSWTRIDTVPQHLPVSAIVISRTDAGLYIGTRLPKHRSGE